MRDLETRGRVLPAAVSFWTFCLTAAHATGAGTPETPAWDPGHRTTGAVRGEVKPDDRVRSDGVYDRFDGDVTLTLGLGAEVGNGARAAVAGRLLYYHTGAVVLGYGDALGADSALERVFFAGGELRPLFLTRWQADAQFGIPMLDLVLDSLALGAGAYFGAGEDGEFGDISGFEGTLGLGVPLSTSANGLWVEARATYRTGLPETNFGGLLLLSLYAPWVSPLVR